MEIARDEVRTGKKTPMFELIGGHPALDLVNTLDWRFRDSGTEELLRNYADVVRFTEQSGLMTAQDARRVLRGAPENKAEKVVATVRALREAAAEVLYAVVEGKNPAPSPVRMLEACFNDQRK